jgi:glycosyltransferase involved in cell wall biosynthesis
VTGPDRRLRILQVFQPADGGVPEHVWRLSRGLARRGHHVQVAGPPEAALRPRFDEDVAEYRAIPIVGRVPAPAADIRSLRGLAALLDEGVDLVHAHGQKAGFVARAAARRRGVPALYSPHSFVYRTQVRLGRRGGRARRRALLAAERALGRRTAAIIACAQAERRAAIEDGIADPDRVEVILYGVDPDPEMAPDPELVEFRGEGPLLGFVAGLRDQKGLPTLLDALDLLSARGEAPRFAIVGNGPLQDEVDRRAGSGALSATTIVRPFAGRVEPYLRALDVFVLPSYWEGMPIAVLEAMALGLPVVATAVDGTPEAVLEGRTGMLVAPGDAEALAARLTTLAADADARRRMGQAAREEAHRRFGLERMVDEFERLYRRVAAS